MMARRRRWRFLILEIIALTSCLVGGFCTFSMALEHGLLSQSLDLLWQFQQDFRLGLSHCGLTEVDPSACST